MLRSSWLPVQTIASLPQLAETLNMHGTMYVHLAHEAVCLSTLHAISKQLQSLEDLVVVGTTLGYLLGIHRHARDTL